MSRIQDALRRAELIRSRSRARSAAPRSERPFRVIAVASNKGGVGKTTVATNLAVFVRALREELPVLLLSLDDQTGVDRMFALDGAPPRETIATALRTGHLSAAIQLGEYGVHYVPSDPRIGALKGELEKASRLDWVLRASEWKGLVIVDTKSDLEILTQNALAACDLAILPVSDQGSLDEAQKVLQLLEELGQPPEKARIVLSLIDRRIKYRDEEATDILGLLVSEIRRRELPLFESFLSRSPKVESLYTNPQRRAHSLLHEGAGSLVKLQMRALTEEVLAHTFPPRARAVARPDVVRPVPLRDAG